MKKKIIIIITILFVSIALTILFYRQYYKKTAWNYEGQAVVLEESASYEFVGLTDVVIDGKVYGFGKYFLGDVRISMLEDQHAYCQNEKCCGMATLYRYHLERYGQEHVKKEKWLVDRIIPATVLGMEMPGKRMMRMDWYEWVWKKRTGREDEIEHESFATGYLYVNKAGKMPFAFRVGFLKRDISEEYKYYIIVPGVSTREEAISFLEENFEEFLWMRGKDEEFSGKLLYFE